MPLSFLSNKESDIDLPRNLIGLSEIGGIEYMLLLTLNDNALPFKVFPLTNTRFLDLKGFTDILAQHKTMAARFCRTWVCCREGDIRKRSSMMNAFTGGDKSDWKTEMSIAADTNSKITFIPANWNCEACKNSSQILIPHRWNYGWKGFAPKATIIRL